MQNNSEGRGMGINGLVLGGLLILLGIVFLFGQIFGAFFNIDFGRVLWPFWIIGSGLLLLIGGLAVAGQLGEPLAILGGMITMAGLVLFFQNFTGLWATWAYAWALVVPAGPGLGLALFGLLKNRPDKTRDGTRLAAIGVGIFLVGACFFELIIGISGFGLGSWAWPLLLIGLGLLVLVRNLLTRGIRS